MAEQTRKRGRPPKATESTAPKTWQVGKYQASIENGEYYIRAGKMLILRTADESKFKQQCELIEGRI